MLDFALSMSKAADVTLLGSTGRISNISSCNSPICCPHDLPEMKARAGRTEAIFPNLSV